MNNLLLILLNQDSGVEIEDCTSFKIQYQGSIYGSFYVTFDNEIIVDWGDGNIENYNNYGNNSDTQISHFYDYVSQTTQYTVKIFGNHSRVRFNDGEMKYYIIQLISGNSTLNDYGDMCYGCFNLKKIAPTFFINDNPDGYDINCQNMFNESGIESIEHNLFAKVVKGYCYCYNMFARCNNLITVYNLSIPNKSNTYGMFDSCTIFYFYTRILI